MDCYATCDDSEQKAGIFPHREHENRKYIVVQEPPLPLSREASFHELVPVQPDNISSNALQSSEMKSIKSFFKSLEDKAVEEIVRRNLDDTQILGRGKLAVYDKFSYYYNYVCNHTIFYLFPFFCLLW